MKPSFCHLFRHFSVTMEPHCALKATKHLFKNKGYYHHNANDRFGLKTCLSVSPVFMPYNCKKPYYAKYPSKGVGNSNFIRNFARTNRRDCFWAVH